MWINLGQLSALLLSLDIEKSPSWDRPAAKRMMQEAENR
jgi:hypothetical protein